MNLSCVSLKTLPVATNEQRPQTGAEDGKLLDADLVEEAAKFLKGLLGLTVFGFDVVVSIFSGPANFMMLVEFSATASNYGCSCSLKKKKRKSAL